MISVKTGVFDPRFYTIFVAAGVNVESLTVISYSIQQKAIDSDSFLTFPAVVVYCSTDRNNAKIYPAEIRITTAALGHVYRDLGWRA